MVVELDIFSGRPNPRWELNETDIGVLTSMMGQLERTSDVPASTSGLGYRGFRLSGPEESLRLLVYYGFVRSTAGVFIDPTRRVERFLLDRVPSEYGDLRRLVGIEIEE